MTAQPLSLMDLEPRQDDLVAEALEGLCGTPKTLPCKLLYDARGSRLFDRITELPEYYPSRTELSILKRYTGQIAERVGRDAHVIELGSGSSNKTRLLLDALESPSAYTPVDISRSALADAAERIAEEYPSLEVLPVVADYTQRFEVPQPAGRTGRRVIYFPGSTIGNFEPADARRFLRRWSELAGPGGALLVGVDLRKPTSVLLPAYDDARGVTSAFNLNLLRRLNREARADFDPAGFEHEARWSEAHGRIEMHLVSRWGQRVHVAGRRIAFEAGESIHTECSYKHTLEGFADLAEGWRVGEVWTDPCRWFSVQWLEPA